jgi:hypothetical protein
MNEFLKLSDKDRIWLYNVLSGYKKSYAGIVVSLRVEILNFYRLA